MVQWLGFWASAAMARVQSLVMELRSHRLRSHTHTHTHTHTQIYIFVGDSYMEIEREILSLREEIRLKKTQQKNEQNFE